MSFLNSIFALFVLPVIPIIISLVLFKRFRKNETGNNGFDTAISIVLNTQNIVFLIIFPAAVIELGLSAAWLGFGYLMGLVWVFYLQMRRCAAGECESGMNKDIGISRSRFANITFLILLLLLFIPLTAPMLSFLGLAIFVTFGNIEPVIVLFLVVVLLFSVYGDDSQKANLWRLTFVLFFVSFVVFPLIALFKAGGLFNVLDKFERIDHQLLAVSPRNIFFLSSAVLIGLVIPGQRHALQVLNNLKSSSDAARAGLISVCLSAIFIWCSIYSGILMRTELKISSGYWHFTEITGLADGMGDTIWIIYQVTVAMLVFMLLSHIVSFLISNLHALDMQRAKSMKPVELIMVGVFLSAAYVLFHLNSNLDPVVIWTIIGCAFSPMFLFKSSIKVTAAGAIVTVIATFLVMNTWNIMRMKGFRFFGLPPVHEIIPGFLVSTAVLFFFSYITKKWIPKSLN